MDNNNLSRFSKDTQTVLLAAGWVPSRFAKDEVKLWNNQLTQKGFELFPAAEDTLAEFGGLNIVQQGPGIEFSREPFNLDPLQGEHSINFFRYYSKPIGEKLFPLGEYGGYTTLAIGESGKIYSMEGGRVLLVGNGIDDALEHLIRGFGIVELDVDIEERH